MTDPTPAPAPAPAHTPSDPAPSPAPAPAPAPAGPAWLGDGVDGDTLGYVQNKGWENPRTVVESYKNLEKLIGADRLGRTVTVPKPDAPAEEWGAYYAKLGRPESPDHYGLDKLMPKGADPTLAKEAGKWFHEAGLSDRQAKQVVEQWNGFLQAQTDAQAAEVAARAQQQEGALKKEWGAAFDQNVNVAKQAAKAFGFTPEMIDAMQAAVGYDGVFKTLHNIGSKIGEADFVTGGAPTGGRMTPAQAQAQIKALQQDPGFVKRYVSGGAAEKAEMARLHEMAYPAEPAA